jgi:hypothetical protein
MAISIFRAAVTTSVLLAAGLFSSSRIAFAAAPQEVLTTDDAEQPVTAEFKELRRLLQKLNLDADQFHQLTRSGLHAQTHAFELNRVKDDVNRIGDQLDRIEKMRFLTTTWQREAFDAIHPIALEVAERMGNAIQHLSDNKQLWAPVYVDHLRTIPELSDQMYDLVDNHLKIVDAREKLQNVQREMEDRAS